MLNENKPFKELFDHFREEPDASVWVDLKKDLTEKRNKKRVAYLLLFSCFIIVLTGIVLSISDNASADPKAQSEITGLASHSAIETNKPVQSHTDSQSQSPSFSQLTEASKGRYSPFNESPISEEQSAPSSGNTDLYSNLFVQSEVFESEAAFSTLRPLQYFPKTIDSDSNSFASLFETQIPPLIVKALYIDFSISGFQAGLLKTDENKNLILKGNALGLDFKLMRQARNFEFGIGLNYTYSKTQGVHNWDKADVFEDSIIVKKRYTNETRYHRFIDTNYISTMDRYQNKIQYLSIPVSIGYCSNFTGKFNTYVKANFQFGYLFNSTFNSNYDRASGLRIENSKDNRHRLIYGAGIQIGFLYSINHKTQLNLGLNSNVLSLGSSLNQTQHLLPYSTGLSIGIKKKINFGATNQ